MWSLCVMSTERILEWNALQHYNVLLHVLGFAAGPNTEPFRRSSWQVDWSSDVGAAWTCLLCVCICTSTIDKDLSFSTKHTQRDAIQKRSVLIRKIKKLVLPEKCKLIQPLAQSCVHFIQFSLFSISYCP